MVHYLDCAFFYAIGSYDFINVAIKNEYYLSKMYTPEGLIVIRYYLALRGAENGVTVMVTPFFCVQG